MAFDETSQKRIILCGKNILYSIIGGVFITLATSLIPNAGLLGTSKYGFPFAWLSQLLYPIGSPLTLLWTGLILDLLVWITAVFLIITIYQISKPK